MKCDVQFKGELKNFTSSEKKKKTQTDTRILLLDVLFRSHCTEMARY